MRAAAALLVLGLFVPHIASCLKICAFNVQSFGESKASNRKVMGVLLKVPRPRPGEQPPLKNGPLTFLFHSLQILSRCDLCLLQEVRDSKGEAVQALVKDLNRCELWRVLKTPKILHICSSARLSPCPSRLVGTDSYSYLESERLGRTRYKEQYVYIYRYSRARAPTSAPRP